MPTIDDILAGVEMEECALYALLVDRRGESAWVWGFALGRDVPASVGRALLMNPQRILVMPIGRIALVDWRRPLPTPEEMTGQYPDLTRDMSTKEYLDDVRGSGELEERVSE